MPQPDVEQGSCQGLLVLGVLRDGGRHCHTDLATTWHDHVIEEKFELVQHKKILLDIESIICQGFFAVRILSSERCHCLVYL